MSPPDLPECEASDTSLQIDIVMDELHVPAEERSDWLPLDKNDPGYHEYTDKELVTHVREESEENEEEDDDDNVVTQTVSHSQACQVLETVLVPYSGKLSREKTLFFTVRTIRESFLRKFCGHTYIIIGRTQAIRESFLCEIFVLYRNAKLFSLENFPLCGISGAATRNTNEHYFATQ